ncbi:MAG TPA: hypothetical protein VHF50_07825 [Solirubrobacterales bacterium]|nr:hypothetical protein [Solirubrobacterales bacterium]
MVGDRYAKEIRQGLGFLAAWLPNESIEVGQIGEIDDGQFQPTGHLRDLDFEIEVENAPARASLSHRSSNGVEITFKAQGDASIVLPGVSAEQAGVRMRFRRRSGVVFQADGVRVTRLKPSNALEQLVCDGHRDGSWKSSWVVVDSVVKASHVTAIVSNAKGAEASLRASAGVESVTDLAKAEIGLKVAHEKDLATCIVAEGPLTPLFTAKVLRRRRWRRGDHGALEAAFEPLPSDPDEEADAESEDVALIAYDYPA